MRKVNSLARAPKFTVHLIPRSNRNERRIGLLNIARAMSIMSVLSLGASMASLSLMGIAQTKPAAPAPKPQSRPKPTISSSPIRRIDFRNFDYEFHNCPQSGQTSSIHLRSGVYVSNPGAAEEVTYAIPDGKESIVYGAVVTPENEEAIVTVTCKTKTSPLVSSEYFVISVQGNSPTLIGSITEQRLFKDFRGGYPEFILMRTAKVGTRMGRISFGYYAGRDLCCEDVGADVSYRWTNGSFVSDGMGIGSTYGLENNTDSDISGKVIRRPADKIEIQNDSGTFLLSRTNYMAPAEFANYEVDLWKSVWLHSLRGQAIKGVDCLPVVHFPNQPATRLLEGEKEISCYRIELIPSD